MKARILYDTRFGNTEKIARSLGLGLIQSDNIENVTRTDIKDATLEPSAFQDYGLICVGGPTEGFTASKSMKEFLDKFKHAIRSDHRRFAFAFDTKLDSRLAGSAAKYIEKQLAEQGYRIVWPRQSAIVFAIKSMGSITGAKLKEGEDIRFEQLGASIARAVVSAASDERKEPSVRGLA